MRPPAAVAPSATCPENRAGEPAFSSVALRLESPLGGDCQLTFHFFRGWITKLQATDLRRLPVFRQAFDQPADRAAILPEIAALASTEPLGLRPDMESTHFFSWADDANLFIETSSTSIRELTVETAVSGRDHVRARKACDQRRLDA